MHGWMDGLLDGSMDRSMDRWMDGLRAAWMGGCMEIIVFASVTNAHVHIGGVWLYSCSCVCTYAGLASLCYLCISVIRSLAGKPSKLET